MERWLARENAPYAQALAASIRAGIANVRGDSRAANTELRIAAELAEEQSFHGLAAMAKYHLGGRERTIADRYFLAQGVDSPRRIVAMYVPGFK